MSELPQSVVSDGTRRALFLPAVAVPDAVTVAEATAGDNISCYLTGQGWQPTEDQANIPDTRLCSSQSFEKPGRKTKSLTLQYVINLSSAPDDEARLALGEGTSGFLLHILQKAEEDGIDPEVGDWYELWPATMGDPMVMPSEENSVDRVSQRAFVTGPVVKFAQIVA